MRKAYSTILLLLLALVTGFANTASAADTEETTKLGSDVYFTLGYKTWINTWQTALNSYPPKGGANIMTMTSQSVAAPIFSASLKVSNFLIAGSFMKTPDYTFPDNEDVLVTGPTPTTVPPPGLVFYTFKTSASRKENDINLGYYISPSMAVTIGIKNVKQTYNDLNADGSIFSTSWTKYSGPIVGITGGGRLGESDFAFYGNLSYGILKGEFEGDPETFNANYSSTELGIAYRPISFLSFLAGYKYQTIDSKLTDPAFKNQVALDVTKGFILGANLTF
ncbi:MAG: hypothetical protein AABZ15_07175 [Nitrospirota bacterium]